MTSLQLEIVIEQIRRRIVPDEVLMVSDPVVSLASRAINSVLVSVIDGIRCITDTTDENAKILDGVSTRDIMEALT
jgi:hypothetical protein